MLCILQRPHGPNSRFMRLSVIPKTCLLLVGFLSLSSLSSEGPRLSRHQAARIDSCLAELTLAGKSADSATRVRIESSVRIIRAQLAPIPHRSANRGSMDSARFGKLLDQVRHSYPYRDQLKILQLAAVDSWFTVTQVDQLLRLVDLHSNPTEAANILLPRIVDLENVEDLRGVLWTVEASRALDSFINSRTSPQSRPSETPLGPPLRHSRTQGVMDSVRFHKLRRQVEQSFRYREQRQTLLLATVDYRFTVMQVDQLLRLVTFSSDKADAAKILIPRVVDRENLGELRDVLWATQPRKALDDFLDSLGASPPEPSQPSPLRSRSHTP